MGYLRLVPTPTPSAASGGCLESFDRELDYLLETLRRLGARPPEIEDLVQEVFLVLHRHWPTLDTTRPLRPYLFGVAFRIVSGHRRRWTRETPYAALDTEDRKAISPEGSLGTKESQMLLLRALERVPLSRRAVVVMHELDEVPIADIARALSISRFGAYARLRKGRKELTAAVRRLLNEGMNR